MAVSKGVEAMASDAFRELRELGAGHDFRHFF
jgi:hypothetical protein